MSGLADHGMSRRQVLHALGGAITVATVGSLAGCGGQAGGDAVSAWIYRPEYREAIEKILAAFDKAHPDIDVDMSYKPNAQYPTLVKTALTGGAAPDALATAGANGVWGDTGADGDNIIPLDGKVPTDELIPTVARAVQYKGHTYAAPVQMFKIGIYYQRQIFAKYKLRPPQSWDDLLSLSKELADNGVTAWSMPAQDMILPFFFYHLAVNSVLGPDGFEELRTGQRRFTDPDLVSAAQLLKDVSQYFNRGYQAVGYTEGKALFAQGKTAMIIGGSSDYAGYTEINPKADVGFFGFPAQDGKRQISLEGLSMAYTVNKRAKHQKKAVTFVSWLTSEEAQRLVLKYLGLPSRKGVAPQGDDARSAILRTILEVPGSPSWLDYPVTGDVSTVTEKDGAGIFSGRQTAQDFAEVAQSAVKLEASS